ncbi:hypothetical protein L1987_33150 [Smallanthus sonchifolius]|uniref:Uncharacterized protein n=1 Tax=Smallanthus sonchifolius TaxID=185202 RepID=A0ACB9HQX2_9ASTR|nr:hypothetical protein L1987_33150 [Smallanthus sonchifolius]
MDANGELKKSSSEDIEGLLSLYEASYLGSSGEDVLSHAMEITTRHLRISLSQLNPKFHKKVFEGLKLPRHMRMGRLEARRYIEEYEPSFSGSKIELAKAIAILLVIDDIYDTYGSYDDLILFTEAIKRDMYGISASFLSDIRWGYIRKCITSS